MANTEAPSGAKKGRRPGCGVVVVVVLFGLLAAFCALNQAPTVVAPLGRAYPLWVVLLVTFACGVAAGMVLSTMVVLRRGRAARSVSRGDQSG